MNLKISKVSIVTVSVVGMVGMLAGCGNSGTGGSGSNNTGAGKTGKTSSSTSGKAIKITYWSTGPAYAKKKVVAAFNKKYAGKYKVVYTYPTYNNEVEAINSAVAAHKEPDIMEESFTPSAAYAVKGLEIPITKFLKMANINPTKMFPASLWNQSTVNGVHYAAPTDTLTTVLFYNKAMFKAAGLNPNKPPQNQKQFVTDAQKITNASKGVWGFVQQPLWPNQFEFPSLLAQFNGQLANAKTRKMLFDSPQGTKALQFEWNTIYKWKVSPQNASKNEYINLFEKGKNAMILDGTYEYTKLKKALGSNLGVAKLPLIGTQQGTFLGQNFWWVFKKKSVTPAVEKGIAAFMKYYYENWSKQAPSGGILPTWEPVMKSSKVTNNPLLDLQLQQLKYGRLNPAIPNWGTTTSQPLYNEIGNVLLNKETPARGLKKAAAKMNKSVPLLYN